MIGAALAKGKRHCWFKAPGRIGILNQLPYNEAQLSRAKTASCIARLKRTGMGEICKKAKHGWCKTAKGESQPWIIWFLQKPFGSETQRRRRQDLLTSTRKRKSGTSTGNSLSALKCPGARFFVQLLPSAADHIHTHPSSGSTVPLKSL